MNQSQPNISFDKGSWKSIAGLQKFSHEAMATTFEILIVHNDAAYAEQAAAAAFDELDRLEDQLSRHVPNSDISRINNLGPNQPLRIGLDAFESLQLCRRLCAETEGAFDITVGALVDYWRDKNRTAKTSTEHLAQLHKNIGLDLVKLDEAEHTVTLTKPVDIDLGGFGKGYAVDKMAELLRDWGIDTALIHSGGSSVLAIKAPPSAKGWPLTLSNPTNRKQILAYLHLKNRALSGSGLQKGLHIIDPRTAEPVKDKAAAWACAPNAAAADALSTAFMVMSPEQIRKYCLNHPDTLAMLITGQPSADVQEKNVLRFGRWERFLI